MLTYVDGDGGGGGDGGDGGDGGYGGGGGGGFCRPEKVSKLPRPACSLKKKHMK